MASISNAKQANEPFNGQQSSDAILRTSDGIDFHIHRIILILGSDFFRDMFSLPQPEPAVESTKPVIDISESSKTLDTLLRLCYPIEDPIVKDLTLLRDVLEAALKYQFTLATSIMKTALRTFIKSEPLHVYAIYCRLMLEEDARSAACQWKSVCPRKDENVVVDREVMEWKETIAGSSYIKGMADISAGAYYRLMQFVRTGKVSLFCIADSAPVVDSSKDSRADTPVKTNDTGSSPAKESEGNPIHKDTPKVSEKFNFTDHDLTVTSSDDVEFRLHEVILRLASPKLVQNMMINDHGNKHLSLPEDSETLTNLFEICYPVDSVDVSDVTMLFNLFAVAHKYELTKAIEFLRMRLMVNMHSNPLLVYFALAGNDFLGNAAYVARIAIFQTPIEDLYIPEMENISAELYYHLLEYRHKCLTTIVDMCSDYEGDYPSDNLKWWDLSASRKNIVPMPPSRSLSTPIAEKSLLALQEEARNFFKKYYKRSSKNGGSSAPPEEVLKVGRFSLDDIYKESKKLEEEISDELSDIEIESSCSFVHKVSAATIPR